MSKKQEWKIRRFSAPVFFACLENKGFVGKNACCAICIVEEMRKNLWLTVKGKWYIFMLLFFKQI